MDAAARAAERRMIMVFPFECPVCGHKTNMQQTNADRVRAMNAEQLAEWALFRAPQIGREYSHSLIGLITWLQQPAEESE